MSRRLLPARLIAEAAGDAKNEGDPPARMKERRANTPEQPESNVIRDDPLASPLGRGANPGEVGDTHPLSGGPSITGQRGHAPPAQRGGPEGFVDRENEDMKQTARDSPPVGHESSTNDAGV